MNTRAKGSGGETAAYNYLIKHGYTPVCQNYWGGGYEMDLIVKQGQTVVFVEVKLRKSNLIGSGREAVTVKKQAHIIRAAEAWAAENECFDVPMRFDVIEINLAAKTICHIKNAFGIN